MSRAVRLAKKTSRRHHLHVGEEVDDELAQGLLFNRDSRTLFSSRGIVGETDTVLQVRDFVYKSGPGGTTSQQEAILVAVELIEPLQFLITAHEPSSDISQLSRHLHAGWTREERHGRVILCRPEDSGHLDLLERAASHLPQGWYAEGSVKYLQLFRMPATTDENELEETLRLAGELRPLLVAT